MNIIVEDYVSFETAKVLKEKGFDEPTHQFYKVITYLGNKPDSIRANTLNSVEDEPFHNNINGFDLNEEDTGEYAMPTHQMAMKWLREVYDECIVVQPIITDDDGSAGCLWQFTISKLLKIQYKSECVYERYEAACDVAIKYCLEKFIGDEN